MGVTHFASVLQLLAAALAGMLFVTCGASKVDAQSLTRTVQTGEVPWDDGVVGQGVPVDGVRPTSVGVLRSLRAPVSVHVVATGGTVLVQDVLGWAERALDALEFVHGFGQPLPDGDRGGDGTLDLYLVADGAPLEVSVDRLESDPWDRASAFVRIRTNDADPATLRRRVTEGIARAIVLGAKADHPPAFVAAAGASLARMVTGEPADPDAVRAFQREPSRAVFGTWRGDDAARGAGLFLDLVAARWDDDAHKLVRSLIVAPALRTPLGWHRLWDEPDVFDIARRMFRDEPGKLEGVLADFSVARAVLGTRADHDRLAGRDDSSYALRPMRVVRSADFPAWVVAREALEPTGCAVVELDLDDAPLRATTAVWFHGSPWQRWVLRAVRIRGDGTAVRDLGSDVIADGEWSLQLDLLDGYTRVLFVVTNLGDLSYDPDVPQSANGFFAMHFAHGGR